MGALDQRLVLCTEVAAILLLGVVVSLVGCSRALRMRILEGVARVLARPDPVALLREVAAILLSDEWREQLRVLQRRHGRRRLRQAVRLIVRDGAPAGAYTLPVDLASWLGKVSPAALDPDVVVRRRGRAWLGDVTRGKRA
jgi:hypothetical protein